MVEYPPLVNKDYRVAARSLSSKLRELAQVLDEKERDLLTQALLELHLFMADTGGTGLLANKGIEQARREMFERMHQIHLEYAEDFRIEGELPEEPSEEDSELDSTWVTTTPKKI